MDPPNRPIRSNRGVMPERFRDVEDPAPKPKTGAAYFAAANEDTQMQTPDLAPPVERTRARTRGQGEHPGNKAVAARRNRKRKEQALRPKRSVVEFGPIQPDVDIEMYPGGRKMPTIPLGQYNIQSQTSSDPLYFSSTVQTKSRRAYSRVIPEDGSEPAPISEADLAGVEKQEDDLEDLHLKYSQWKLQFDGLDQRILDNINKLKASQTESDATTKPQNTRKSVRGRKNEGATDFLMFDEMNDKLSMGLVVGVMSRQVEYGET